MTFGKKKAQVLLCCVGFLSSAFKAGISKPFVSCNSVTFVALKGALSVQFDSQFLVSGNRLPIFGNFFDASGSLFDFCKSYADGPCNNFHC